MYAFREVVWQLQASERGRALSKIASWIANIQSRRRESSRVQMEDAPNDLAVLQHVIVVVAPTRWRTALEDQPGHRHVFLSA